MEAEAGEREPRLKIGTELPVLTLLSSAKLCLCAPLQGTPGGVGIDPPRSECTPASPVSKRAHRSEEHTSELQSR